MSPTDDEIRALLALEVRWQVRAICEEVLRLRAENERLRSVDPEREKRIEDWRGQMQLAVGDLIKETIAIDKAPSSGNGALDAQALHDADGHVDYLLEKAVALMRSAPTSQEAK